MKCMPASHDPHGAEMDVSNLDTRVSSFRFHSTFQHQFGVHFGVHFKVHVPGFLGPQLSPDTRAVTIEILEESARQWCQALAGIMPQLGTYLARPG